MHEQNNSSNYLDVYVEYSRQCYLMESQYEVKHVVYLFTYVFWPLTSLSIKCEEVEFEPIPTKTYLTFSWRRKKDELAIFSSSIGESSRINCRIPRELQDCYLEKYGLLIANTSHIIWIEIDSVVVAAITQQYQLMLF